MVSTEPIGGDVYGIGVSGSGNIIGKNIETTVVSPQKMLEHDDKVVLAVPLDSYALEYKAEILRNLGRYDEALECYDKVIQLIPELSYEWKIKGSIQLSLNNRKEAENCFNMTRKFRKDSF